MVKKTNKGHKKFGWKYLILGLVLLVIVVGVFAYVYQEKLFGKVLLGPKSVSKSSNTIFCGGCPFTTPRQKRCVDGTDQVCDRARGYNKQCAQGSPSEFAWINTGQEGCDGCHSDKECLNIGGWYFTWALDGSDFRRFTKCGYFLGLPTAFTCVNNIETGCYSFIPDMCNFYERCSITSSEIFPGGTGGIMVGCVRKQPCDDCKVGEVANKCSPTLGYTSFAGGDIAYYFFAENRCMRTSPTCNQWTPVGCDLEDLCVDGGRGCVPSNSVL